MATILVTGALGFLGRHVVPVLARRHALILLVRPGPRDAVERSVPAIASTLEDLDEFGAEVTPGFVVLHLAARTGRAPAEVYHRTNVIGTRRLLDASVRAGCSRFVLVSSIAATYADRRGAPYAESKRAGEVLVRESGLPFDIIRPTLVLGTGGAVLEGLRRLAAGPVGIRFGAARNPVQPVHVDDVVRALAALLEVSPTRQAWDIGGPEALPLRDLLIRIRETTRGTAGPFVTLPLRPVRAMLRAVEAIVGPILPLTAGQLSLFANRGTVTTAPPPGMGTAERDLPAMLREFVSP